MDERQWQAGVTEVPIRQGPTDGRDAAVSGVPSSLSDPRALTILTTEHWSLLSARSLVYNEAFARAGMFLTFMSGTFVALGLMSTASGFTKQFLVVTAIALALDLFVGVATIGRLSNASREDIRYLQGMNRLRHAYHEMVPGLEKYFVMRHHDDIESVFGIYDVNTRPSSLGGILHGLTTTIGMVAAINAALCGILAGVVVLLVSGSGELSIVAAVAGFMVGAVMGPAYMILAINRNMRSMVPVFPTPPEQDERSARVKTEEASR